MLKYEATVTIYGHYVEGTLPTPLVNMHIKGDDPALLADTARAVIDSWEAQCTNTDAQ